MYLILWINWLAVTLPLFGLSAHAQTDDSYIAMTGVQTGVTAEGARPARRNLLDLQNDIPAWSLFIQAFTAMQAVDEGQQLSFFGIAGLHGRPFVPYNNFAQYADAQFNWWKGYCPHGSVLFLSWHTIYMVLIEQVMASWAQTIAVQYTGADQAVYQNAADNLRFPFWDFASIPQMPPVMNGATVEINTPTGVQTVNNPLYQYTWQKPLEVAHFPETIARRPTTSRRPESNAPDGRNRPDIINDLLGKANLMQRTWDALVKNTQYNEFATSAAGGTSIEWVHNEIHLTIAGAFGTMGPTEYSAFDPIFWVFHCNIDRLYAIWMAMNPGNLMTPIGGEAGTMSIPFGNIDSTDTPLYPFTANAQGSVYTSAAAYQYSIFGYSWPEIEDWNQTPEALRANVTAQVNAKYDPNGVFSNPPPAAPATRRRYNTPSRTAGEETKEWAVSIEVNKYELKGAYFVISIFVGCVPEDPAEWPFTDTRVDSMHLMPPPLKNITDWPFMPVYDEISLTKVVENADIDVGDAVAVKQYLKENLDWRVQKLDGTEVDLKELPSLNFTVGSQDMTLQKDITSLPTFGERQLYREITHPEEDPEDPMSSTVPLPGFSQKRPNGTSTEAPQAEYTGAGSFLALDSRLCISWALFFFLLLSQ
ncbi:hypothetical protein HYALB_00009418 [Hymenoscyphus albidus]|uniref:Tyrosinase copper-binding domain-containing protein n=1 Tax=Hymenoscyphus albidus TaxID=595503 RepID=A0A9N9PV81_9HELO|nr:hypothetical protein HYALB_00009418 [Hymenoscyphus albidus]